MVKLSPFIPYRKRILPLIWDLGSWHPCMARGAVVVWEIAGGYSGRKTRSPVLYADHNDGAGFGFDFSRYGGCREVVEVKNTWKCHE